MIVNNTNSTLLTKSFNQAINSLTEREQFVIDKRIGLSWDFLTLQEIWNTFEPNVTRERVRQIEESWITKIGQNTNIAIIEKIQKLSIAFLELNHWVSSKDVLLNQLITDLNLNNETNKWMIDTIIQWTKNIKKSKQTFWCKIYYFLDNINKSDISTIHKTTLTILNKQKKILKKQHLYEMISKKLMNYKTFSLQFINSVLTFYNDIVIWENEMIGLAKWKILNPKTLKDKAMYVLKRDKVPLHFVEITNRVIEMIKKPVKVNTIHNELIRNEDFVLIWRWIYALKEWWFTNGTVMDVITSILKEKWWAMNTEEITKKVLNVRNVKASTIYMNLQNKNIIQRVWRNFYQLKDS